MSEVEQFWSLESSRNEPPTLNDCFRDIVESVPTAIVLVDEESRIRFVNARAESYFGYAKDELAGKPVEVLIPVELRAQHRKHVATYLRQPESKSLGVGRQLRALRKDGSTFPVEVGLNPLRVGGRVLVVSSIIDISLRRGLEDQHLRDEGVFKSVMECLGEGVVVADESGKPVLFNPAAKRITRHGPMEGPKEEWSKKYGIFYPDMKTLYPAEQLPLARAMRGETVDSEVVYQRFGDEPGSWLRLTATPLVDEAQTRLGGVLVLSDITEQKEAEDALRRSHDELEQRVQARTTELLKAEEHLRSAQKMEAVGTLAGGIAHDFNNWMTVVSGFGELLLHEMDDDDPRRGRLEAICQAASEASGLTRQLLAFSRRQVLQPRVTDLNEMVTELIPMLRRLVGEGTKLTSTLSAALGQVRIDLGQIQQVIVNLVINAGDATSPGGELTIETSDAVVDRVFAATHVPMKPGAYVRLSVRDTGSGMDEETRRHIFEPFFTTKAREKGTGLGLSTVYGIVKQSDGFIFVATEVGLGTTFEVYLPRVIEKTAGTSPDVVKEDSRAYRGSEMVLLVEDNSMVRALVVDILGGCGYSVLEAANGPEAILAAERHDGPIHLLLSDIVMPQMSGLEVSGRLRSRWPDMRVLFMSGYSEAAIARHGVFEQGASFLAKPFAYDDLARAVREVLDRPAKEGEQI